MDENLASRLLDYATYLACSGTDDPAEEAILSIFGWLAYEADASIRAEVPLARKQLCRQVLPAARE